MDHKYTAIIVEPRRHAALIFVLNNALECLPNNWNIILFHGNRNSEYSKTIANKLNLNYNSNNKDRLSLVHLNIENLNMRTYSELLANRNIIYDHIHSEYFLVFQTDSMIFKKNSYLLEKILNGNYDYIGAPWLNTYYKPNLESDFIGNGGFSLRKKATMIEIIEKHKYNKYNSDKFEDWAEDLYFTKKYPDIKVCKPSYEMAKKFSVESVFTEVTFGCHKPWLTWHYPQFVILYPECEELRKLQYEEL
jgi:hypothetical protein